MKRVVIESPYKGATPEEQEANVAYAKACMLDSLRRGEAPFASHLLYTQVLDDAKNDEREMGIAAGLKFVRDCDLTAVYIDRGVSSGMLRGTEEAARAGRAFEVRSLEDYHVCPDRPFLEDMRRVEVAWRQARFDAVAECYRKGAQVHVPGHLARELADAREECERVGDTNAADLQRASLRELRAMQAVCEIVRKAFTP